MGLRGRATLIEERFFFVTTTVVEHTRVFSEPKYCDILIDQIKTWQVQFEFSILGYVIMPSHFHWIVEVNLQRGTVSDIMRELKSHAAWAVMDAIERDGRTDLTAVFIESGKPFADQRRRFWEKRFDDQVIRNQKMLMAKLSYIHNNPVKAGLVAAAEEYRYSSARNYIMGDHSVLYVDTSYAG
jgi:putative transposase